MGIRLMLLLTMLPLWLRTIALSQEISIEEPAGTPLETSRVVAWGDNSYGQTTIPTGLSGVQAISAGASHTVALKGDGTVVAWGSNSYGQTAVPSGLTGVRTISAGGAHTVALKSDGTVVAWGRDDYRQSTVPAGLSGVWAIAAGGSHTLALKGDGTVSAWGYNGNNELGIPLGLMGVQAIAAGSSHSVALKSDGTLVAWGPNSWGQATIPAGLSGVQAIAAGLNHTVALRRDGTVFAWGYNGYAQTTIPVGLSGVRSIAAGMNHTVALKSDGTVVAWGANAQGQATIPVGLSGVQAISAGSGHTVALQASSIIFADQRANTSSSAKVVTIKNTGSAALHISAVTVFGGNAADFIVNTTNLATTLAPGNGQTTFSVTFTPSATGLRQTWLRVVNDDTDESLFLINLSGTGILPDIGIEQPADVSLQTYQITAWGATPIPAGLSGVRAIAAGAQHAVGLKSNGTVVAWGDNSHGQTTIPAGLSNVQAIAAGDYHTVALKSDGTVVAWGDNYYDQTTIPAGLSEVQAISAGGYHTVALKRDGTVVSWGRNNNGETTIPAGLSGVQAITAGGPHTVALKSDGTVVAWGENYFGQSTVPASLSGVQAIATGGLHTVALKNDGTLVAWGYNEYGQATVPVGLSGVQAIACGHLHTVALKSDGTVVAWGYNGNRQTTVPEGLSGVQSIWAGGNQTVALKTSIPTVEVLKNSTTTFPNQPRFTSSVPKVFTIKNSGNTPLNVSSVSLISGDVADFAVNTAAMLTSVPAANGRTTFSVAFTPVGPGWRRATLRVVSDDVGDGIFDILLVGYTPADADIAVFKGNSTAPGDEISDNLAGSVSLNTLLGNSATQTFTIKNAGPSDPLADLTWDITGANASDYVLSSASAPDLAPNATTTLSITFTPKALGLRSATIRIYSDDPDESPFEVNLSSSATSPEIAIEQVAGTSLNNSRVDFWGPISSIEELTPVGLTGVQSISAGGAHTLALKSDGTVFAWGKNASGQTTIPPGLSDVRAISAGESHSVALRSDGTVVAWGDNSSGQTTIPAGLSGVLAISAGYYHTVALKANGTVVAWGSNGSGQSKIPAGLTGVQAISGGAAHTVALKTNGTVVAWGNNGSGQTTIPAGLSGVKAIAAGGFHTLALKKDGTIIAWGDNSSGQSTIPPGLLGVEAIVGGYFHSMALKSGGTAVAWGHNFSGESAVPGGLSGVQAITAHYKSQALTGSTVSFANQAPFTSSAPKAFAIKNIGTAPLHISCVSILSGNASDFTVNTTSMATTVPEGNGQTTLSVTFTPTASGLRQARLRVVSDDLDEGTFEVLLTGYATDADIAVFTGNSTAAANERTNNQAALVLANTLLGTSASQTFTIKNAGPTDSLTGIHWDVTGANASDFVLSSSSASDLAPNATTTFNVTFTPRDFGPRTATIRIHSNDPDESPFAINLNSTAIGPEIGIEQPAGTALEHNSIVTFSNQTRLTASAPKMFTIRNSGTVPLHISGVSVLTGNTADFTVNTSGMTTSIPAGNGQTTFSVTFTPRGKGWRQTWLRVVNDDADEGTYEILLTGYSPSLADIAVFNGNSTAPADGRIDNLGSLVFPTTLLRNSSSQTFTIKNAGPTDALSGLHWDVTGTNASEFALGSTSSPNLAPNATTTLRVTFTPQAYGLRTATLSIYSDDPDESPFRINLRGNEFAPEIAIEQPAGAFLKNSQVVIWGDNSYGQTTIPAYLSGVKSISSGGEHTVVMRSDGTVVAWGNNIYNQTNIPAGLSGMQAISAGKIHTLALKSDGAIVAWGDNGFGQTMMPAGLSNVKAISAGAAHSVALLSGGTVVAWGWDAYGQTTIPAGLAGVQAIAAGYEHTVALKSDGTLVAWGSNSLGQATVPAGLSGVQAISAGYYHTLALKSDGTLLDWGDSQTTVPAGISGVRAIAAGGSHAVALKHDGTVVAWGNNEYGQTTIPAGLAGVQAISASQNNTAALKAATSEFGNQPMTSTSPVKTFTIKNTGVAELRISSVSITGANASEFSISTVGMLTSVPAITGQTTFNVTFRPSSLGPKTAWLSVRSNDLDDSFYEIVLSGMGTPLPPPQSIGTIPSQRVRIGTPLTLDLAQYFISPNGASQTYAIVSNSTPAAVTAKITGSSLLLTGVTSGTTTVILKVKNGSGFINATFKATAVKVFPLLTPVPKLSVSQPRALADGSLLLRITANPGHNYQVQTSADLTNWVPASKSIQAGATNIQWIDRNTAATLKKFYRVRELIAP